MAFLHAHGLDVDLKEINAHLLAVIKAVQSLYNLEPSWKGLTANEADVAHTGGLDPHPFTGKQPDPLLLGVLAYARLIQSGLTTAQAADRVDVSKAKVRQRIKDRTLFALRDGHSWKLPVFQFTEGGELPGWGTVAQRLPSGVSPVAVEGWLLLPHSDLVLGEDEIPLSPRVWLLVGRPPQSVAALAGELA